MKPGILTRTAFAAASVAVLVPLAGCSGGDIQPSRPPGTSSPSSPRASTDENGTEYKDGTYTAKGVYGGAPSYLTVTVILSADTVTKVTVSPAEE